jgi:ATP synthase F1 gamma subunit
MKQHAVLTQELSLANNMKNLTLAYEQHAIEQINFARYSVLASHEFSEDLASIFYHVRNNFKLWMDQLTPKQKRKLDLIRKHAKNGKTAFVLVAANNKLYGDIIQKICRLFMENALKTPADLFIIGKQGKNFIDASQFKRTYDFVDLPDTNITMEILQPLYTKLIPYEKVTVFCGRFNNMVSQDAVVTDITGDQTAGDAPGAPTKASEHYFFEPDLEQILNFFENQIFSILLGQTISDSQLARFGSRIQAMEGAQTNMQKVILSLMSAQRRLKHADISKKQLELFAGRRLWKGRK